MPKINFALYEEGAPPLQDKEPGWDVVHSRLYIGDGQGGKSTLQGGFYVEPEFSTNTSVNSDTFISTTSSTSYTSISSPYVTLSNKYGIYGTIWKVQGILVQSPRQVVSAAANYHWTGLGRMVIRRYDITSAGYIYEYIYANAGLDNFYSYSASSSTPAYVTQSAFMNRDILVKTNTGSTTYDNVRISFEYACGEGLTMNRVRSASIIAYPMPGNWEAMLYE